MPAPLVTYNLLQLVGQMVCYLLRYFTVFCEPSANFTVLR